MTDLDRLRGYDSGAVDYIPVPVVPEVLRAKVRVFADLHRKTHQLQRLNHDLEALVEERTMELKRSNEELQQFAYVASHDLQEPLRMVSSFVQLLSSRYSGKLDADADEFIRYAVDGAKRMHQLIDDLLSYSRLGTGSGFARVSCDEALDRALANLQLSLAENGASVTREPLPTVIGDDIQLVQLFQNLVANAIKFRRKEAACTVHVGCEDRGTEWLFSVRDNGIGIDSKYLERIFLIFQRLHGRSEYSGSGIGLAVCKKIVERHRGRIWAESELGQGSVLCFTLPVLGAHLPAEKKNPPPRRHTLAR
jgi:light-regulated signal transduction histidine kinase (bacteriophytochrome)